MTTKNRKYLAIVLFCILNTINLNSQTEAGYKLYRFNALVLNPAQAGSNDYSDISILGSSYWVGVQGAPKTFTASGNYNVMKNFGIGVSVIKDQVGPLQSNSLNFSGAYHLRLNNSWKFSTGLKLTAMEQNVILSELTTTQSDDPDMQENLTTGLTYNAGFGFLLYSSKLFLGASLPRVASIKYSRVDMTNFVDKKGGCIVYAGGNVKIKEKLDFRPSAITYFGYGGPLNLDLNASFTIHKKYDFGISYQLRGSLGAILGMNIKDKFYVGYTYVYPLSQLNTVSTQSHELALRFMFKKPLSSADSPRFFN